MTERSTRRNDLDQKSRIFSDQKAGTQNTILCVPAIIHAMQSSENRAINQNSLNGVSFPINIDFSFKDGLFRLSLIPISVLEIIELIPFDTFLVFNVDAHEYFDLKPFTLAEIINKYSSYSKKFDEQTVMMTQKSVIRLLNEISHYNFCLIDVKTEIDIDKVIQIIDFADKWNEITVINEVYSNVFLSSHDDCYLYIETNDENLALDLISLQIKTLVTTISERSIDKLKFDPKELLTQEKFSIMIPQNPVETSEKVSWKIFDGTFKDFVYNNKTTESKNELVYFEANNTIKIEKVRSCKTSD